MPIHRIRAQRTLTVTGALAVLLLISGTVLTKSLVPQFPTGIWAPAGNGLNLSSPRVGAAAVQLGDGRILVSGGDDGSGAVASADIFDASGNYSAAAPMNVARSQHTATLLADGTVLAAGGVGSDGNATNSAEIYNPSNNTWSATGPLVTARSGATATVLPDGTALISGGDNSGKALSSLEVYDPTAGTFTAVAGTLSSPREKHAAAALPNGDVLIAGGWNGSAALATTDVYSFSSGSIAPGPQMSVARSALSATAQLNGDVLIAGGNDGNQDLASAEVYNASAGTFAATGSLGTARQGHQALLLPHSAAILIVGGTTTVSGTETATSAAELYYPLASGTDANPNWNGTFNATGAMASPRVGAAGSPMSNGTPSSANDGIVFVAGGKDSTGSALATGELYGFAWVKTDAADYAPGTPVNITGGGWRPGETVTLHLQELPYFDSHPDLTAVADSNGNISNNQFAPDVHDIDIRFYLTATGSASQAQTTFTDATPTLTITGAGTGKGTVTSSDGNINCTITAAAVSGTCSHKYQANFTGVILTAANATGSSFTQWGGICSGTTTTCSASGTGNGTFTATATFDLNQAPAITSANNTTFTAGTAGNFTVTATGTPTPTFSETGALPSSVTLSSAGVLSGTSTVTGSFPVTITASNGVSPNATQSFTLNVIAGAVSSTKSTMSPNPTSVTADGTATSTITVTLLDANSNPVSGKTVTLTQGTGSSTISASSGQSNASGVVTFTVKDTKAEAVTYTARDSTDNIPITQTAQVTFTAGTATKLAFNQQPSTTTAGSAISPAVTVQVEDANGNVVTTDSSTVAITISAGGAFSGTSTLSAAASSGVATFSNLIPTASGTFTLSATDGSLAAATSNSFIVNAGPVAKFVFSPIGTQTVGTPFNVTITAEDANGNTVTTFNAGGNNVTLTSTGNLSGAPFTTPAFTNGVLVQNVTITNAGSFTITATGNAGHGGGTGTSNTFTVNQASTSTTLSPSANPSAFGESVTFTATVTDSSPGSTGTPTGTVTFKDGSTTVGTSALSAGVATSSTASLSISGSPHSITAVYSGDPNFVGSTSSAVSQAIKQASSTTGISLSSNSIIVGQSATVTATVSPQFTGTPTGTVTVSDGLGGAGDTCAITLAAGTGTCNIMPSSNGSLTVTGNYGGDGNFTASSGSAPLAVTGTPPIITSAATTSFTAGTAGTFAITTTGIPTAILSESTAAGQTGLPNGVTFIDNHDGTATLSGTATVSGSYTFTITASNGVGSPAIEVFTLVVSPGAFTQLQVLAPGETAAPGTASGFTGTPTIQYVNGAFNLTVSAVDQNFNVVNTITDTVAISSNDSKAILPANGAALVGGTGIFSVTPETVSNPATTTFTATDTTTNSITPATTPAIEVITAYTAAITPTMTATGNATAYTLTISNGTDKDASNLASATIAVPTADQETIAAVSVSAMQQGGGTANWTYDPSQLPGVMRFSANTANDAVAPGGMIAVTFTATSSAVVNSAPVEEAWNTVAFTNSKWTSSLPLASAEPTVGIGIGPSFTSAASTAFTFGSASTFTVSTNGVPSNTLSGSGSLPPGVTFTDKGNDTATIAGTPSSAGTYSFTITAHNGFGSDATQSFTLTVNKADTSTSVISSLNPSTFGQSVTFTASVSVVAPAAGNPTGTVQFEDNNSLIGAPTSLSGGSANLTISNLQAGPHSISALYSGDANFNGSSVTSPLPQTVSKATPIFSNLTASQTIAFGTKTISVSGHLAAPTATPPDADTATILINSTPVTVALSGGAFSATLNTATLPVSATPYVITYSFEGDSNFNSASDSSTSLIVNPAPTTITVISNLNPSTYGQTVTFTALVTNAAVGSAAVPTGSVSFTIDGTPMAGTLEKCPSAIPANRLCAAFSTSALTAGGLAHVVNANFTNTDGNFVSGSGMLATGHLVNPAPLIITASSGVMTFGNTPFVVMPMYTGFVNGEGAGNLNSLPTCGPIFSIATPAGPYTTSCVGAIDPNYSIAYVTGNVVVQQATSATAVVSSSTNNTSIFLQTVTFTATIGPEFSGSPSGTVTFYDAAANNSCAAPPATNIAPFGAPVAIASGVASISTADLAGGATPHTILACYSGDTNFLSSFGSVSQTVVPAPVVAISPTLINFTGQNVGSTSNPTSVTLTNNGDAELNINGISIPTSSDSAEFNFTTNTTYPCGTTLGYPGESPSLPTSCTISVTFSPKDTGEASATLAIIDNNDDVSGAEQDITLTGGGLSTLATDGSLFTNAIVATAASCGSITLGGGATIDSFSSAQGPGAPRQLSGGNVLTNGNVTLNGNSIIYGAVAAANSNTGSCKSSMTGLSTNGAAKVTGGLTALSSPVSYPLPPAPNPAPPTITQAISHACPSGMTGCAVSLSKGVTLAPGTYGNVQIGGGTNVALSAGTYNFNSLSLGGNSILTVGTTGPIFINIAGAGLTGNNPALDLSGGSIVNATGIPSNLEFFYGGSRAVNLTGNAQAYATLYAPAAPVSLTGGSDFFGGIIGLSVTSSGGTAIHYDRNLANVGGGYLWLTAVIHNVAGLKGGQAKLYLTNSTIQFTAGGNTQTVNVPNAVVTLNSVSATTPKTSYDLTNGRWITSVPAADLTGNTFVTGVAIPVPAGGFPSGIQNLSWSAAFSTDTPLTFQWQWSAGVYSTLGSCYAYQNTNSAAPCYSSTSNSNVLNVNPEDGTADLHGTDPAGTPENDKQNEVIGFFSAPAGVVAAAAEMSVAPSNYAFSAPQTPGTPSGVTIVSVLTNNDGVTHLIKGFSVLGAYAADFALQSGGTNNCMGVTSLAAGASCNLNVIFTPSSTGAESARIVVNDDANNTPQTVYLTGSGE
ncbi:MAG TPA: Ig-like domain repeat protein [Silvibacterium sp.]|nr:Ig-like domain repeat protein [Silvibacterium sp.]